MITAKIQAIFIKTNIADFLLPFLPFPKTLCYIPLQAPHINGWAVSRADFKTTRQNGIYPYTCPAIITMLYSAPFWDYFPSTFQFKKACCFFLNNNNKKLFQQENSSKLQPIQIYFPTFPNQLCCCRFVKVDDTGTSEMAAVPQVMTEFCIPALFPLSARILSNACSNALK